MSEYNHGPEDPAETARQEAMKAAKASAPLYPNLYWAAPVSQRMLHILGDDRGTLLAEFDVDQMSEFVAEAIGLVGEFYRSADRELGQLRARIEELERQREAVLALCDQAVYEGWGEEFGGSHEGHCIERDEIRAIYGGGR